MTQLAPQNIIDTINSIELMKSNLNLELLNKKEELKKIDLFQEIHDIEISIKQLEQQDDEIREQWKQILLNAWMKKFEALDWTVIQINATPPSVKIINEDLIPNEYKKTITTTTIDKKLIKEEINLWVIIDWVELVSDYKLVIKNPK